MLNKCISEFQSAFVPGRSILDNGKAVIEIIHYMKIKLNVMWEKWLLSLILVKIMTGLNGIIFKRLWKKLAFLNNGLSG